MISLLCVLELHRWSGWDANGARICQHRACIANQTSHRRQGRRPRRPRT